MSIKLNGKTALVTGGARGIGLATVEALIDAGANVTFTTRNAASAQIALDALGDKAEGVTAVECDATDRVAVAKLMQSNFDILINNAGVITPIGRMADVDISDWAKNIDVNLVAAFYVIQQALPHMVKNGGTIVNLSSGAAHNPMEGRSAYCSSKAGVAMLTRCVHEEYGTEGVRVFGFAPGVVDTGMQGLIRDSGINKVSKLNRSDLSPVSEPAHAIAWLCTDAADGMAGQELDVRNAEFRVAAGLEISS